jgi:ribosome biogenesis protein MAK21
LKTDTVKELFLEDLLPPDRKLIPFDNRSGSELQSASKKQLVKWIFEDKLKSHYFNFVEALKKMASDTVEKLRGKALSIIHQLLTTHPELEDVCSL